jgi:hypothetical protein
MTAFPWTEHRTLKEVAETEDLRAQVQSSKYERYRMNWARLEELTARERAANGKRVADPPVHAA